MIIKFLLLELNLVFLYFFLMLHCVSALGCGFRVRRLEIGSKTKHFKESLKAWLGHGRWIILSCWLFLGSRFVLTMPRFFSWLYLQLIDIDLSPAGWYMLWENTPAFWQDLVLAGRCTCPWRSLCVVAIMCLSKGNVFDNSEIKELDDW